MEIIDADYVVDDNNTKQYNTVSFIFSRLQSAN